jgi:hypothetical protein
VPALLLLAAATLGLLTRPPALRMSPFRLRRRFGLAAAALGAAMLLAAAPAGAATSHPFSASYTGSGAGSVNGMTAAGYASGSGRASIIGAGSFRGSAHGMFTSTTCVTFSGSATLRGAAGTLTVRARQAHACVSPAGGSFSGVVTVASGTGAVAGAHGTLRFRGSYDGTTGAVKISFSGSLAY